MQYAYLGSNVITLTFWFLLFWVRKDLRKMMLTMSIMALPLAFFDLMFVPSYWNPVTLFHIPIGIEGFLFAFSVGGIASVLYAELTQHKPQRIHDWHNPAYRAFRVPVVTFAVFVLASLLTRIPLGQPV